MKENRNEDNTKENEYIGFIEGYAATTDVDLHGDKLTPEAIENMAEQINNNPKLRIAPYNHDITQPMGYITDFRVDTKGSWKGLHIKVGVYKSRPDLWKKVLSGDIKGFSYGARIREMEYKKMPDTNCSFTIEIINEEWHQICDILSKLGAKVEPDVRKAWDTPIIITVTLSILTLPASIYGLYDLWKRLGGKSKGQWMKIKTIKRKFDFNTNTVEEITNEIELDSKNK
jgi:HK97 family phage prohead protease